MKKIYKYVITAGSLYLIIILLEKLFPRKTKVVIDVPSKPMFVGSYKKIGVKISSSSSETIDDFNFTIAAGAAGGVISLCRDEFFNAASPDIMLCVGYKPGTYELIANKKSDGTEVGRHSFEVTSEWDDEKYGPSKQFIGQVQGYNAGAAWGGGPTTVQNYRTTPHSGTWRVTMMWVDFADARYPTDAPTLQGFRDRWMNEVINGVTDTDGKTKSSNGFYSETSYNTFNLTANTINSVVSLPNNFSTYFNADGTFKSTYPQTVITAADSLIDYTTLDSFVIVACSPNFAGGTRARAWPYSAIGKWGPYTSGDGNVNLGIISMPNEWGTTDNRDVFETFSHEMGHNLGLGDQYLLGGVTYSPAIAARKIGNWEMMDWDDVFPHFTIAHRLMFGWVNEAWIKRYNFLQSGAPVNETVSLSPVELGSPPSGRFAGIEIRIADGWNYYLEYRKSQAAQIADQLLDEDSVVVGTDVVSGPYTPPTNRPGILRLRKDADGDGDILSNGEDYKETDTTDPAFPTDFKVSVSGIDGSKADVRIQYGVNSKPDPSIRKWPASPERQWQSPDIVIENVRNLADPANWFNVPWINNLNTIKATVKNNGTLAAPQVTVDFFVKDFNVGGTPEFYLGTDVQDLPASGSAVFQTTWVPPSGGHYCIIARIQLYQTPAPGLVVEMTQLNNEAQSNYDRFISATASPAERKITHVSVGNPFTKATEVYIFPDQINPLYRTYLEYSSLWLEPGEQKKVMVMFEYDPTGVLNAPFNLLTTPDGKPLDLQDKKGKNPELVIRNWRKKQNNVNIAAYIVNPYDNPRHVKELFSGVQVAIATGKATEIKKFTVNGLRVRGFVATKGDGSAVESGKVIITTRKHKKGEVNDDIENFVVDVKAGVFSASLEKQQGKYVQAYFLPQEGYGDCYSEEIVVK